MSEDQQNRFAGFRERKSQIEKDIGRTDRSHPHYVGDNNPNVALLQVGQSLHSKIMKFK